MLLMTTTTKRNATPPSNAEGFDYPRGTMYAGVNGSAYPLASSGTGNAEISEYEYIVYSAS